jgi:methyltransferase
MTLAAPFVSAVALAVVVLLMLMELRISRRNERTLESLGAIEPHDAVYQTMRWAYPGVFVAMAIEGSTSDLVPAGLVGAGFALFVVSKVLKFWAIASLGRLWTYRVFVLPGEPLVTTGPYRWMRHPNYVAVVGEIVAMALVTAARVTGPAGLLLFGSLLMVRIRAEERALRLNR